MMYDIKPNAATASMRREVERRREVIAGAAARGDVDLVRMLAPKLETAEWELSLFEGTTGSQILGAL